jgi:hypothetical protein
MASSRLEAFGFWGGVEYAFAFRIAHVRLQCVDNLRGSCESVSQFKVENFKFIETCAVQDGAGCLGLAFVAWSVRFAGTDGDRARVVPSTNNGRRVLNQEATS